MTTRRRRIGQSGERLAADYLIQRGHQIIARNVRRREGEVDLVTVHNDTLVFVEVKLRRAGDFGGAIEALSTAKQRRLSALAAAYAAEHPELPAKQRVDLIAIDLSADGVLQAVQHIESAVED